MNIEFSRVQMLSNDFAKRGVKLIALSCDEVRSLFCCWKSTFVKGGQSLFVTDKLHLLQVDSHNGWIKDIIAYNNLSTGFSYPIIADPKREVSSDIFLGSLLMEPIHIRSVKKSLPIVLKDEIYPNKR